MRPGKYSVVEFDLGPVVEDPAAAFVRLKALSGGQQGFMIVKQGASRRVYLGAAPFEILRVRSGRVICERGKKKKTLPGNPFAVLGARLGQYRAVAGKAFSSGAVGYMGYEMVHHLEKLPPRAGLKQEAVLMLFDRILILEKGRARLFALIPRVGGAAARQRAGRFAKTLRASLAQIASSHVKSPLPLDKLPRVGFSPMKGGMGRARFMTGVRKIKKLIREGDMFQCVLSERFKTANAADPLTVFRSLALRSRSPYLFLLKDGREHLVGASPERLVEVLGRAVYNSPIAGTRPRGGTPKRDKLLEKALRRSPKERAEHLMLVDLSRNDIGKIAAPGTVKVTEFMSVRRFSHVMHLVSEVEGRLDVGINAWDALAASFPAGTVSGAPKVRAMERLARLEPVARGFYAGALIQHDFSGNLDSCIAIRTMSLSGDQAILQAGAGIVADSDPGREYREVLNKLRGLRWALGHANSR